MGEGAFARVRDSPQAGSGPMNGGTEVVARRRGPRLWVAAAVGLAAIAAVLLGARLANEAQARRTTLPSISGRLAVPGVDAPVEILRDRRGVPHIRARNEADAWLAMGFVHAQDRLDQMLWQRRVARGRTAEVLGEPGFAADHLARTVGIGRAADAQVERLSPTLRGLLEAYAEGVNARIERRARSQAMAPGVAAADAPDPWTPGDSLALLKLVHWCNGPLPETALLLEALIDRLGGMGARPFFPTGLGVQGMGLPFELPASRARRLDRPEPAAERAPRLGTGFSATGFALSGRMTASGSPILVVDLHLPPTVPSGFYELQAQGGALDASGATIPGIPIFWAGRNAELAWAATPAQVLTINLYREVLRPGPPEEVRSGSGWEPLSVRDEEIFVREPDGTLRSEVVRVRATRHGPLVGELLDAASITGDRQPLSLAWTGALAGDGLDSFAAVARSKSADELVAALRGHHEPVLAVVYADRAGTIGTQLAGWIPRLALPTGMVPVPARLSVYAWRRRIGYDGLPSRRLDEGAIGPDWVIAADNPLADSFGSGFGTAGIEWMWRTGERGARVEEMLETLTSEGPLDLRRVVDAQAQLVGGVPPEFVAALLRLAGDPDELSPEAREVASLLRDWDGEMGPDSPGAAAYHVLLRQLIQELFAEPMGPGLLDRYLALPWTRVQSVVERLVIDAADAPTAAGWSDPDRVRSAVRDSLESAWRTLRHRMGPNRARWRWGALHEVAFEPLGPNPPGPWRPDAFGSSDAVGGFADYDPAEPYAARRASLYRMAVDLGAPDRMLSHLAPGQSEHADAPHFDDGLEAWRTGRPGLFATSRFLLEEGEPERLVLEPGT